MTSARRYLDQTKADRSHPARRGPSLAGYMPLLRTSISPCPQPIPASIGCPSLPAVSAHASHGCDRQAGPHPRSLRLRSADGPASAASARSPRSPPPGSRAFLDQVGSPDREKTLANSLISSCEDQQAPSVAYAAVRFREAPQSIRDPDLLLRWKLLPCRFKKTSGLTLRANALGCC